MTDTPTVVEVTAAPATPATPPKPTTAPAVPAAAVPGVPLALAAANAAGTVASGALALGVPAALAVAGTTAAVLAAGGAVRRARNRRTLGRTSLPSTPGAARSGARGSAYGQVPASRTAYGAAPGPVSGLGGPSASGMRAATRAAAHRTGHTAAAPHSAPTVPVARHSGAGPVSGGHRSAGHAAGASRPTVSARTAHGGTAAHHPGSTRTSNSTGRKGGSFARPGVAYDLRKPAAGSPSAGRWPGLSPQKAAKIAQRTDKRLAKGLARARKRAGLDPVTGADAGAAGSKSAAAEEVSAQQAKMLRRSELRHAARMTGSGLAAGLVGAASAAAFNWRHKGRVSGHMRAVWRRLADRARAVKKTRDAAILAGNTGKAGTADTPAVPVPAERVNVPGRPEPTAPAAGVKAVSKRAAGLVARITLGKSTDQEATVSEFESTVPAFSLSSAADVMLQAASTFDPEHMTEFGTLADDLPVAFATIQEVLRVLAEKGAEQLPLDQAVSEEIAVGYQAMGRVVQALENVAPVFRQAHAEDLERVENPRNGLEAERKWNV
ncbi:hypothetical protein [Kitasatospora sp. MBT63]|uniref:hypothetical protein n=1 Tax=Kitasatospora sp. MBT63 TaxID=1444768 RepID=UPI00053A179E|nr:hypothetical protein [Kitasatospora sp. MBT63]